MKKTTDKPSTSRRQFLRRAAATTGAAAAVAATSTTLVATEVEAATESEHEAEEGYRLTQHILDYYKSAAS